jgi:hypothetical protein
MFEFCVEGWDWKRVTLRPGRGASIDETNNGLSVWDSGERERERTILDILFGYQKAVISMVYFTYIHRIRRYFTILKYLDFAS